MASNIEEEELAKVALGVYKNNGIDLITISNSAIYQRRKALHEPYNKSIRFNLSNEVILAYLLQCRMGLLLLGSIVWYSTR
jgi:hypothetical protein